MQHGTVLHGVQLDEAARLEAGGNHEEVGTRGDEVRDGVGEADDASHAGGQLVELLERLLHGLLAGTEDDNLRVGALLEELGDSLHHDVATLLFLEAADVAEHGGGGVEGEANFSLERLLGRSLAHHHGVLVVGDVEELIRPGFHSVGSMPLTMPSMPPVALMMVLSSTPLDAEVLKQMAELQQGPEAKKMAEAMKDPEVQKKV